MHPSSFENMRKCYRCHIEATELEARGGLVLDVGGSDVNGSYRSLFETRFKYEVADLEAAPGVQHVLSDPYRLPLQDQSVDIVVSGQAFEHIEFFWRTFEEMVRVLHHDGYIFLIAPSGGPEHRYPVDCYRFYPDAYAALAKHAGCENVETYWDERGPWRDLVGVFRRRDAALNKKVHTEHRPPQMWSGPSGDADEEKLRGAVPYLVVLERLHELIKPEFYFEIGVRNGRSLTLAQCPALGVDPIPEIDCELPATAKVVAATSDDYFEGGPQIAPDMTFIDGLHLFEFALRDFMHAERLAKPGGVIVIDDVSPNHHKQAMRDRQTNAWTGDVWKLHEVLKRYRPELKLTLLDAHPTGLLLVSNLDPKDRVLWDAYNPIVRQYAPEVPPPKHVLDREGAVPPTVDALSALLAGDHIRSVTIGGARKPHLSIVIVSYNMARELPRTIRSFSPAMQRGIQASDYELILVDNGSQQELDEQALLRIAPNLKIHRVRAPTVSPVPAINLGMRAARGDLIGVCIDGARMASPGLLAAAVSAARTHERAVIGSLAFHLGPDVQMKSVLNGYDREVEDRLLAEAKWQEDGYRLFDISVFAGSSSDGWFVTPAETNALFLHKEHFEEIGGYDPGFLSPGGGLANLDMWRRACEDERGEVVLLLGEGTFHQVHGGVATNAAASPWDEFHKEYVRLRGRAYERPARTPKTWGVVTPRIVATMRASLDRLST